MPRRAPARRGSEEALLGGGSSPQSIVEGTVKHRRTPMPLATGEYLKSGYWTSPEPTSRDSIRLGRDDDEIRLEEERAEQFCEDTTPFLEALNSEVEARLIAGTSHIQSGDFCRDFYA